MSVVFEVRNGRKKVSERTVRRFCKAHLISRRTELSNEQLDALDGDEIAAVGHSYGSRTMQGMLRARESLNFLSRSIGRTTIAGPAILLSHIVDGNEPLLSHSGVRVPGHWKIFPFIPC